MNDYVLSSVGQALRDARETRGMTLEEAAARLRLMNRQVEAMEADEFEALGQPVFARGFVRNYARLLELPADDLLAQMHGVPADPAPVVRAELPQSRSWLTSPWLIVMLLGVVAVLAVPVGLYLWLNSEPEEAVPAPQTHAPRAPVAAAVPPPVHPAPTPVDVAATQPETDVSTPPLGGGPGPGSEPADATAHPAAVPAPTSAPAVVVTPGPAATPAVTPPAPPANPPVTPPPPAASSAPVSAVPSAAPGKLHLEFDADSWTEIRDGNGRALHRQLDRAGSSAEVQGQPPFAIVIGNAAQARVSYNGRQVDLKPYIDVTVARFTLGN